MAAVAKFVSVELDKCDAGRGAVGALVLGDLNARNEEVSDLLETGDWCEARYQGKSWNPMVNRFYPQEPGFRADGLSFDRVFFKGSAHAASFLAGTGRRWADGRAYALSDHFAVYGLLDMHSCLSSTGAKSVREQRRVGGE